MQIIEKLYSFEIPEPLEKLPGVRKKRNCTDIYLLQEESCSGPSEGKTWIASFNDPAVDHSSAPVYRLWVLNLTESVTKDKSRHSIDITDIPSGLVFYEYTFFFALVSFTY